MLWGLWVSAHTVQTVMLGQTTGYLPQHSIPRGLVPVPLGTQLSFSSLWTKFKKKGVFPPHTSCCWQPLSSPGKPRELTWKTQSRRPPPGVIFSTSLVWWPLTQSPYPLCTIFRDLWAETVPDSQSKAAPCCSSPALGSSRSVSTS